MSVRGLTPQVKTYRRMDDGYPLEKTPSKESQTCGRRQAEHEPGGHGLKDLLQETRSQHIEKYPESWRRKKVGEWTIFFLSFFLCMLVFYLRGQPSNNF